MNGKTHQHRLAPSHGEITAIRRGRPVLQLMACMAVLNFFGWAAAHQLGPVWGNLFGAVMFGMTGAQIHFLVIGSVMVSGPYLLRTARGLLGALLLFTAICWGAEMFEMPNPFVMTGLLPAGQWGELVRRYTARSRRIVGLPKDPGPSVSDRAIDSSHGVPDLIKADDAIHLSGPDSRRGGLAGEAGYPA